MKAGIMLCFEVINNTQDDTRKEYHITGETFWEDDYK